MGNWGISQNASQKEKIKSELADHLHGLNATGEISYATYSNLFDISMGLLDRMYAQGKETDNNETNNSSQ